MRAWGPGGKAPWQGSGGSATSGAWGSVPRARRSRASETSQNVNRGQANADGTPDSRAPKHNGVRRMQTGLPIPAPQITTVSGECRRNSRLPRPKTQRGQANADGVPTLARRKIARYLCAALSFFLLNFHLPLLRIYDTPDIHMTKRLPEL